MKVRPWLFLMFTLCIHVGDIQPVRYKSERSLFMGAKNGKFRETFPSYLFLFAPRARLLTVDMLELFFRHHIRFISRGRYKD